MYETFLGKVQTIIINPEIRPRTGFEGILPPRSCGSCLTSLPKRPKGRQNRSKREVKRGCEGGNSSHSLAIIFHRQSRKKRWAQKKPQKREYGDGQVTLKSVSGKVSGGSEGASEHRVMTRAT